MLVRDLIKKIDYINVTGDVDIDFIDITRDSREVKDGFLFIAVVGEHINGHEYTESVIEDGARVIVHSEAVEYARDGIVYIRVQDTRVAMADISKAFFDIGDHMEILGVTGTNGKTTSTTILKQLLESTGAKVGLIGTIANYIGDTKVETERTTPESIELFRLMKEMELKGCDYCIMEVSSHASALDRIKGLDFLVGAFTNLTQDHLDFHKTFDDYYSAKYKFVKSASIPVVNIDDAYGYKMCEDMNNQSIMWASYGIDFDGYVDYKAENIKYTANGSEFDLKVKNEIEGRFCIPIPGKYNVYNALAVMASIVEAGLMSIEEVRVALERIGVVDGRCERVAHSGLNTTVVIDYAHTPDGLSNILKTMKDVCSGKLITVFGCGGNRDATKRPLMAVEACKYSDYVIVTSDNPRHENPTDIIKDIMSGMTGEFTVLEDRKCAIEHAIGIAKKDDIVVIAGKGHETYQIIGDTKTYFSDKDVVLNYCNK